MEFSPPSLPFYRTSTMHRHTHSLILFIMKPANKCRTATGMTEIIEVSCDNFMFFFSFSNGAYTANGDNFLVAHIKKVSVEFLLAASSDNGSAHIYISQIWARQKRIMSLESQQRNRPKQTNTQISILFWANVSHFIATLQQWMHPVQMEWGRIRCSWKL